MSSMTRLTTKYRLVPRRRISGAWAGALLLLQAAALPAQTYTTVLSFDLTYGANPVAGLVQGIDGNLYGTTPAGGLAYDGTIYKISTSGLMGTIYHFCLQTGCPNGSQPLSPLWQAASGEFYGTASMGGRPSSRGTIFRTSPHGEGQLHTLYRFCSQPDCTDGNEPRGALVQDPQGNLYGTTILGGANCAPQGCGTVFKITPAGVFTMLYSFCAQTGCGDGSQPIGGLTLSTDGNLYGTTEYGGTDNYGTVFQITPDGALTTLHSFDLTDGAYPETGVVQAANGDFYGTTSSGGTFGGGNVFRLTASGALKAQRARFSAPPDKGETPPMKSGAGASSLEAQRARFSAPPYQRGTPQNQSGAGASSLEVLYDFCSQPGCTDGQYPNGLIPATDGSFYGTTLAGGTNACPTYTTCGTIFKISPAGALTTLYDFCSETGCVDGSNPTLSNLVQDTNGDFYGVTRFGGSGPPACGSDGCGVIFSLSVGLAPFVEPLPAAGQTGSTVEVLGTDLTSATSVLFNGTPVASFTVNSSGSAISTTVPATATSGSIQVVTTGGTLSSNTPFRVLP
jgi:uncharacterized repeat protein (TIGR03803 family)